MMKTCEWSKCKKQLREIYGNMTEGISVNMGFTGLKMEKTYKACFKLWETTQDSRENSQN